MGSNSNVAEHGMEEEEGRAAIWEVDVATGEKRLFATGTAQSERHGLGAGRPARLWTVANERDELGDDLVPDYLTSVKDGGFYGWPYSYFGQHVDERVEPPRPDLVAKAHCARLRAGRARRRARPRLLPATTRCRRDSPTACSSANTVRGIASCRPATKWCSCRSRTASRTGMPIDVLTGFVSEKGEAWGRPVGVAIDKRGALLVADDVGNVIWRAASSGVVSSR